MRCVLNDLMRAPRDACPTRSPCAISICRATTPGVLLDYFRASRAGADLAEDYDSLIEGLNREDDDVQRWVRSRQVYLEAMAVLPPERGRSSEVDLDADARMTICRGFRRCSPRSTGANGHRARWARMCCWRCRVSTASARSTEFRHRDDTPVRKDRPTPAAVPKERPIPKDRPYVRHRCGRRMKVVILAGGRGSRLAELTEVVPKPMVQIGERPILWHIMKHFAAFGHNEFVLALGYKGYVIKEFFLQYKLLSASLTVDLASGTSQVHDEDICDDWKIHLVETGVSTGTGGRLHRLRRWLNGEPFLLTYGDGVSDVDLAALADTHHGAGSWRL
jgi:hypothetical protein